MAGASHFTIYKLDTDYTYERIVNGFNKDKDIDDRFVLHSNNMKLNYKNIVKFKLYIRKAKTIPDWSSPLTSLVTDFPFIENINFSYVLFVEVQKQHFVLSGGSGYHVITKFKEYNFGIELLSRLIEPDDRVIKRINDRYITGHLMGSDSQYLGNVAINSERNLNAFFEEINLALDSHIIEAKFGVKINTNKESYRFLATDSIKLGKSLTLGQLDVLLGSIINLLKEPGYSINPFYMLKNNDSRNSELDDILIDKFVDNIKGLVKSELTIIPFYIVCDAHYILIGKDNKYPYDTEDEIIKLIKENISIAKDKRHILAILKNTYLVGEIEGEIVAEKTLYEHIDVKIGYENKTYWLNQGKWHLIEKKFEQDLNDSFLNKISKGYNQKFNLSQINKWGGKVKEGCFNYSHNEIDSVYVLDKILYNNIEVCDLLVEDKDENKLYFIHVKDGLNGEVRVLCEQVRHAMELINGGKINVNILKGFYNSVIHKIKDGKKESTLSISARKFQNRFKTEESFVETILKREIVFVFAYRPLASHDFMRPSTIKSTAAKLSMIDLNRVRRNYDFTLEYLKIKQ